MLVVLPWAFIGSTSLGHISCLDPGNMHITMAFQLPSHTDTSVSSLKFLFGVCCFQDACEFFRIPICLFDVWSVISLNDMPSTHTHTGGVSLPLNNVQTLEVGDLRQMQRVMLFLLRKCESSAGQIGCLVSKFAALSNNCLKHLHTSVNASVS